MLGGGGQAAEGSLTISLTLCEHSLGSDPGSALPASEAIPMLQALQLRLLGFGKSPEYAS